MIIGLLSIFNLYSYIQVPLDGTLDPGKTDILSPTVKKGDPINIMIQGSIFNITVLNPNNELIKTELTSNISYNLIPTDDGEYTITIHNIGDSTLSIKGTAFTQGNSSSLIGHIMLIITGVVISALGIKTRPK